MNDVAPSVNLSYNQDIHVPADVLALYPQCRPLLDFAPLRDEFNAADVLATAYKKRFVRAGRLALILAAISLTGIAVEACLLGFNLHIIPAWTSILFEVAAAAAIVTFLYMKIGKLRDRWLQHCFKRERIRHFRWQVFLDGQAVAQFLQAEPATYDGPYERAPKLVQDWRDFLGYFEGRSASVEAFQRSRPSPERLMFMRQPYSNPAVADEVLRLLGTLRFHHQVNYPKRAMGKDADDSRIDLHQHRETIDLVARDALVAALILPIVHIGFVLAEMASLIGELPGGVHLSFGVAALWAAVVSGLCRAYLTGMTLPDETESYEDYAAHIHTLTERFDDPAAKPKDRHCLHEDLELEAERELRRFLVMKGKANFVA